MCRCCVKQNLDNINSLDDLSPREKKIFNIIASLGPTNFTTIKNISGFHQEITSRILKRLQDNAIVRKKDGLYDLCCNGIKLKQAKVTKNSCL
jgi:predicted transcriptional regulator